MPSVRELNELFDSVPGSMNPEHWTKMEKLHLRNLDSTLSIPNDDNRLRSGAVRPGLVE